MERVTVKIIGWEGDIPDIGELKTCWVQIRGNPPKWFSWEVVSQIAKTLGLLLDVDWGRIFKSFYEVVRVQLSMKDIHKIPEERIYAMKKKFYWVIFEVEKVAGDGGNDSNNDDNDPDGEDPGCEDGQEGFDELEDMNEGGGDDSHTQTPGVQFGSIGKNDKRHGAKSCPVIINVPDSNSFQPLVDFGLVDDDEMVEAGNMDGVTAGMNEVKITEAANKEEALEMMPMITRQVDEARDMDSMNQDEAEVAEKKNNEPMTCWDENHPTPMEAKLLMAKKTKRDKWGPVLPVRQSERISRDGKSMLERATSRLEIKNLEKPAGKTSKLLKHSFASIPASTLVEKAKMINVSLGESDNCISSNVDRMKMLEEKRMEMLRDEQPDIFLPTDIDYTLEDAMDDNLKEKDKYIDNADDSMADDEKFDFPESSYRFRKRGRKNNYKKSYDDDV
jgi:hypothetical protein